jgi:peroxiredoxin
MRKIPNFLFILMFWVYCGQVYGQDLLNTSLTSLDEKPVLLSTLKGEKATVIVFVLADCPASQSYSLTLNTIFSEYKSKGVTMIGIIPGKFNTKEEMLGFVKDYQINFPVLKDPEMIFTKSIGATIAPECFLLNEKGDVVYNGRIDDWMYALGKTKPMVTKKELLDAITATLENTEVKVKKTQAIGCILEYDK